MTGRLREDDDTIVAIATAPGEGAIGVVRVSGPAAVAVVAPLVVARERLADFPARRLTRVTLVHPATGEQIDDALCVVMRAPRSYTGEDVVELSCHGSPALLRGVTALLIEQGARLAEPGEFTRRAFLNGRLDLAQAEAVALLIGARTERAVTQAARALAGGLSARVRTLREALVDLVAGLEVTLDFPDEEIGADLAEAAKVVERLRAEVGEWLVAAQRARVVHDGLTVALVGAPNAGKSTLLNALVGRERAIVSPSPGTTRDVIDATIAVAGVPLRLLDTAGIGRPSDAIEAEGMRRSRAAIAESDFVIVVADGSVPLNREVLAATAGRPRLIVRSKADLPRQADDPGDDDVVAVSALRGDGMDRLTQRLAEEVERRVSVDGDEGALVASLRQTELLVAVERSLAQAADAIGSRPLEAMLMDLRDALRLTADLLGIEVGDEVLDRIFATFCLGK